MIAELKDTMLKETLLILAAILINYAPIWLADRYERHRQVVDDGYLELDTDSH